jgi:hypothetical protein
LNGTTFASALSPTRNAAQSAITLRQRSNIVVRRGRVTELPTVCARTLLGDFELDAVVRRPVAKTRGTRFWYKVI